MIYSIELKIGTCILCHRPIYYINSNKCKINSFFFLFLLRYKNILIHYSLWSQIIKSMLVSKRHIRGNCQIFYYNCNLCIFTEIFTKIKFFKHLIINTCLESLVESFKFLFYNYLIAVAALDKKIWGFFAPG